METPWVHRVHIIIPVASQRAADDLAVAIGPGGEGERGTFGVIPLSADGATATHFGASVPATDPILAAMNVGLPGIPGVQWVHMTWECDTVFGASSPLPDPCPIPWGWSDTLKLFGLTSFGA